LFYASPEILRSEGIDVKMRHEVTKVDPTTKTVTVKDLNTGKEFTDNYDKLILATGT
jgi:NADPH-dependent 2,4-dienoyl-CoA reductase/sulfur reductase-like enzyme